VEDSLQTLQQLANFHRQQFSIPVIGITGSNGKTTTKELVAAVLETTFNTHFTQGNFNNHIGVPLTLLEMPMDTEIAIIEMGANHVGEIHDLCRIVAPNYGLITNIGKAHLEGFGSMKGVIKAKGELFDFIKENNGKICINEDDKVLMSMLGIYPIRFGFSGNRSSDLSGNIVSTNPTISIEVKDDSGSVKIETQLTGTYNFANVMAAVAFGRILNIPLSIIKSAIEVYVPSMNRSQVISKKNNTIILDAYNANPTSMLAAIENLKINEATKKVAILGDMLELGNESEKEHLSLARSIQECGSIDLILVGELFEPVAAELKIRHYKDVSDLREKQPLDSFVQSTILIKGSRKIELEKYLEKR